MFPLILLADTGLDTGVHVCLSFEQAKFWGVNC